MLLKSLILWLVPLAIAAPLQPWQGVMHQQFSIQPENNQKISLLQQLEQLTQEQTLQKDTRRMPQAPLQATMQQMVLRPLQGTLQQQRLALQEQMFAIQQFQALQKLTLIPSSMAMSSPPILILFPNNINDVRRVDTNSYNPKHQSSEDIGDDDTDVINAEPIEDNVMINSVRAVLLMQNTKSFIGDFISSLPFLPIEINVPDSIAWIYNGIAGIIGGIGQNFSFRPQKPTIDMLESEAQNNEATRVKSFWNGIKGQEMPIVALPLRYPMSLLQV